MLPVCLSSPMQRPLRSAPSMSSAASSRPPLSYGGGSLVSPTSAGAGVRPDHRRLEAAAADEADAHGAAVTPGFADGNLVLKLARSGQRGSAAVRRCGEEVAAPGHCRFTMPGTGSHGSALSARAATTSFVCPLILGA